MPIWIVVVIQVTPSLALALLAWGLAPLRAWSLREDLAAVRAGTSTPPGAYQLYARAGSALRVTLVVFAILAPFAALVANLIAIVAASNALITAATTADLVPAGIILAVAFLPCVLAPIAVYYLATATTDAQAMRELRGLTTRPGDLIELRLKVIALQLAPMLIFFEVVAALFILPLNLWARIGAILVVAVLFGLLMALQINRVRLLYQSTPLAQTPWASLATRATDWARLAGVPVRSVRLLQASALGVADGAITGVVGRTIFLSDRFLQASDWRQQDALIAFLLGLDKRRRALYLIRYGSSLLGIIAYGIILLFPQVIGSALWVIFPLLFLALMVLRLTGSVFSLTRTVTLLADADRLGAQLTGDPLAAMAMLTTVNALNAQDPTIAAGSSGVLPFQGSWWAPNLGQRVASLDGLMRQPGQRAPWAYQPVPSVTPIMLGSFSLTMPLPPGQATAAAPTPVPTMRYPVVMPPAPIMPAYMPAYMPAMGPVPVGVVYPTPTADSSAYPYPSASPYPSAYPFPPAPPAQR